MKTKHLLIGIAILSGFFLANSCKKTNRNNAAEVVQQSNLGDKIFLDFAFMAEQVSKGPLYFSTFNANNCSTLNYDTTGTEVTATIDYGTTNCDCNDGKKRKGTITITYPVDYTQVGSVFTTVPTNYYVDGYLISGSRISTAINNTTATEVNTATITFEDGRGSITYNSNWKRKFIENLNSPNVLAGRNFEVTGTTNGKTVRGDDFTCEITDPLLVQNGCRSIKGGIAKITSSNFKGDAEVNYGSGDCDNKAKLKYKKKEIELYL